MKRVSLAAILSLPIILAILAVTAPPVAHAGEWTGDVNFFLGQKNLKKSDWEPVEDQGEFGAEVSWGKKNWPISIATDVLGSSEMKTVTVFDPFLGTNVKVKLEGDTGELDLGIRKIWSKKNVRPSIGGGLAYVRGEMKATALGVSASESDSEAGWWVGGGVFWRIGPRFNLGIAARYSTATVKIAGFDVEAGGTHLGALLGWGWPASR